MFKIKPFFWLIIILTVVLGVRIIFNFSRSSPSPSSPVPLPPAATETIRQFLQLVGDHQTNQAINLLSDNLLAGASGRQSWQEQLGAFKKISLASLEAYQPEEWQAGREIYQVVLEAEMEPSCARAIIPCYGWQNGQNSRWFILKKENNSWQIEAIATSP